MAKQFPQSLQTHLDSGTTTLVWCWRLTRNDGTVFGFTDHDRPLIFEGTTFDNAGWDEALLRAELAALDDLDFNLDLMGFSDEELDSLLGDGGADRMVHGQPVCPSCRKMGGNHPCSITVPPVPAPLG